MINCSELNELAALYIDNEIDDIKRKQIEKHLEDCEACRNEIKLLQQILDTLGSLDEEELPPTFHAGLHEKLIAVKENESSKNKVKFLHHRFFKTAASIAAGLFLVIALRDLWGNLTIPSGKKSMESTASNLAAAYNYDMSADNAAKAKEGNGNYGAHDKNKPAAGNSQQAQAPEALRNEAPVKLEDKLPKSVAGDSSTEEKVQKIQTMPSNQIEYFVAPRQEAATREESSSREIETRKGSEVKPENTLPPNDNKASLAVSATMAAGMAPANVSTVRNVGITVKTDKPEVVLSTLKTVSSTMGARINEDEPVSSKKATAFAAAAKVIYIKIPDSQYQQFKDLVIANLGAGTVQFGEVSSKDISPELNELNKKLDTINGMIFNLEVKSSIENPKELEKLKQDRLNTLAELERLNSDLGYTVAVITFTGN